MNRYDRQIRVDGFGSAGQDALRAARIALVGLGALGSRIAEDLGRSGVGYLRLIDRDWVEETNLHRQHLYDEEDAAQEEPKALAAADRLSAINTELQLDPRIADLGPANAEELLGDVDLVVDGTDNFRTRYLINDFAVRSGKPWIYGACVATQAMAAAFLPGRSCLRCVFPAPPPTSATPTCETAGILPPAVALATALQTMLVFQVLARPEAPPARLYSADVFDGVVSFMTLPDAPASDCVACGTRAFPALDLASAATAQSLCGRNAVQLDVVADASLEELAERLRAFEPELRRHMLRIAVPEGRITIFTGGRAIVQGTDDGGRARAIFDRYVSS